MMGGDVPVRGSYPSPPWVFTKPTSASLAVERSGVVHDGVHGTVIGQITCFGQCGGDESTAVVAAAGVPEDQQRMD